MVGLYGGFTDYFTDVYSDTVKDYRHRPCVDGPQIVPGGHYNGKSLLLTGQAFLIPSEIKYPPKITIKRLTMLT